MGDGAADAFARETGVPFDSLYGENKARPSCPICGKKRGSKGGIAAHITAVHTSDRLRGRVADALAQLAGGAE